MTRSPVKPKLLALLYLAGLLVLADQAADLVATIMAASPTLGLPTWRFGAFGLLVSRASVFLVADVMLFCAAIGLGHRNVLRALGLIHLVIAAGLLAALGLFALDWLQVRGRVRRGGSRSFDLAALRAGGVAALSVAIVAWAGVMAILATRQPKIKRSRREEHKSVLREIQQDEIES